MIYAAIVAGGTGSRMGADRPKQFLMLCGKPVLIHTIEKFLSCPEIDRVYVGVHKDWIGELDKMCRAAGLDTDKISLLSGGASRDDTIRLIIERISDENEISDSDIILTHDGVRPFVSQKEIRDSIEAMERCGGTTLCLPSTDTLLYSEDGEHIDHATDRSKLFR
ncbi:MAG: D-ribitol-5-phosphate cytidylyltransferase, partial [Ruminococcus sp.]|nr:D-ribitol-5-phosphate cytidylyltransferase [Ruminococcus sp.]